MTDPEGIHLQRHDGSDIDRIIAEISDLYEEVYTEPPYNGGPLFTRARFLQRTDGQKQKTGFSAVTARIEHVLAASRSVYPSAKDAGGAAPARHNHQTIWSPPRNSP